VKHLVESASPYFVAKVSFFYDRGEKVDEVLRHATIELYNRFVTTAFKGTVAPVSETSPDIAVSFFLVQKAGLELKERQEVLSAQSENERLAMLHRHLTLAIPLVGLREKRERMVLNDGYLSPV
jgi:hypothetical protein